MSLELSIDGKHFVRTVWTERGTCAEKVKCETPGCDKLATHVRQRLGHGIMICEDHARKPAAVRFR